MTKGIDGLLQFSYTGGLGYLSDVEVKELKKRTLLTRLGVKVVITWDNVARCHGIEITFAVNGYPFEKQEVL